MNWLDIILILIIVGIAAAEMCRGFGRAVFDALLLYASLWAAELTSLPLSAQMHLMNGAANNHACVLALVFIVFGVIALAVSRFIYGMTLIDTGMFERLLGMAAGIAVGMIVAHGIVHTMTVADPTGDRGAATVADSTVGNEMLDFPTYHAVMDTMTGAGTYRRSLPDVAGK